MPGPVSFARAIALLWAVPMCLLAFCLLFSCVTVDGALFGFGALAIGAAPLLWTCSLGSDRLFMQRLSFALLVLWLIVTSVLLIRAPDGRTRTGAPVRNCYVGGGWSYRGRALSALVPEIDQFILGFRVMPLIDPLMTWRQSRSVAALTQSVYTDLEADRDFHALGSVMPDVYDDLLGLPSARGHYFLYVPPGLDSSRAAPVLLFLHGSGGNFKAYVWILSQVADALGMVVVAPSGGMGDWKTKSTPGVVVAALDDAAGRVALDRDHVCLAGLSNGGLGVTRTAASSVGGLFSSLVLLSPVCDRIALESPSREGAWRGKPVLVVTGRDDNRVPLTFVEACVTSMKAGGASVQLSVYDGADHFLLFSHRKKLVSELIDWLRSRAASGA